MLDYYKIIINPYKNLALVTSFNYNISRKRKESTSQDMQADLVRNARWQNPKNKFQFWSLKMKNPREHLLRKFYLNITMWAKRLSERMFRPG